MKNSTLSVALLTSLLGYSALVSFSTEVKAATSTEAVSSWAISRVASVSQGSYCTMAQKYSNNTVLSFARNAKGEYSLALDFQSPVFQGAGEQTLTLQAGDGQKKSFKASPQTPQAIVIGLGPDENFMKSLDSAGMLRVSYSEGDIEFKVKEFGSGRGELAICMSSLQKAAQQPVTGENAPPSSASQVSAADSGTEPSVEGLLSARPTPSMATEPISSTQTSAPVGKVEVVDQTSSVAAQDLRDLQIENAQLKKALTDTRRAYENVQAGQSAAIAGESQELMSAKLSSLEDENKGLRNQISVLRNKQDEKIVQPESQTQNNVDVSKFQADVQRMTQQVETLRAENTTLKNQIELAASTPKQAPVPEVVASENMRAENQAKMDVLAAENKTLKAALSALKESLTRAEQAEQQANEQIQKLSVAQVQVETGPNEEKLRKQISELNIRVETLEGEKQSLEDRYESLQKESDSKQLKTAGGSWDLEQATRRYQESQREIRRLGAILEDERLKCSADKKEIESMLFDPEIAKGSQIAKLNELQSQVSERDAKIKDMENTIASLQSRFLPEPSQEMESGKEVAALRRDLENSEGRIKDMEIKLSAANAMLEQQQKSVAPLEKAANVSYAPQPSSVSTNAAEKTERDALSFPSSRDYGVFLKSTGISVKGNLERISGGDPASYRAYSWKTDSLYGSVEMRSAARSADFDSVVSQYLSRAKSRCNGDFAAVPSNTKASGADKSEAYEIACVGQGGSSSASILFTLKNGIISTVAHEGRAEAMELAIDARDRIARSFR